VIGVTHLPGLPGGERHREGVPAFEFPVGLPVDIGTKGNRNLLVVHIRAEVQ
jgi:hypothetical protein